jgi:hypothetical protein
MLERVCDTTNL